MNSKFANTIDIHMEYDNPALAPVDVHIGQNMWTDHWMGRHTALTYGLITDSTQNPAPTGYGNNPYIVCLSSYDVPHDVTAQVLQPTGNTTDKVASYGCAYPESISFTSELNSVELANSKYPCLMSMSYSTYYRNFWSPGLSFDWGNETFYVEEPYYNNMFTNASVPISSTSLSMYGVSGVRIGMPIRLWKYSRGETVRATSVTTSTIGITGLSAGSSNTGAYQKGTTVSTDCALIYTCKSTLSTEATYGSSSISVTDGSIFSVNQPFMINDGVNWEGHIIDTINVNAIGITGTLSASYASGVKVYGGFKNTHLKSTAITPRDWYAMTTVQTTFGTTEGITYGVGNPIRTIGFKATTIENNARPYPNNPVIIVLLPYGILKDNATYSGTVSVRYTWWAVARYLS